MGTRTAGGILGLIGGALILIIVIIALKNLTSFDTNEMISFLIAALIAIFGLVGGIVALASDSSGGGLILAGGIIAITVGVVHHCMGFGFLEILPYSAIEMLLDMSSFGSIYIIGIPIEGILIFVGGILVLSDRSY